MKKLSLAAKIGGGFGIVILLLILVSFVSWRGLSGVRDGFVSYRSMARESNLAGRLQTNMLMVRLNVSSFLRTGSDKNIEEYREHLKEMNASIEEAHKVVLDPKRAEDVDLVTENMLIYGKGVDRIIEIRDESDKIVNEGLRGHGPNMVQYLTEIMASARDANDADVAYEAGVILRDMLKGRLAGQKFIGSHAQVDYEQVKSEFANVLKGVSALDQRLHDSTSKNLNAKVKETAQIYLEVLDKLATILNERNAILTDTFLKVGPVVLVAAEDINSSVKKEQDILGPIVQAQSHNAIRLTLIVACIAIVVGVGFAIILTRSITGPIQKVVEFINKVAKGDFTSSLKIDQQDEVGTMANALNQTTVALGAMIKDITNGVNTLTSSSTELATISTQLSANSEDAVGRANSVASATEEISVNMSSVSAAMEQSSSNIGMVASAAEEMSATVSEIAQNAAKAKTISEDAVVQSHQTATKVNELGTAADKIGKVTEVITEISEQTNLLALNATIEAARAGEAGKGFAVVANEIKELAKQTAEATVDIKIQIEGMQGTTSATISDIQKISGVITEINEVITTIATAVEQQSAATSEISENIAQASAGIGEVNENVAQSSVAVQDVSRDISEISNGSSEINSSSQNVNQSANELSRLAEQLDGLVRKFKVA